MSKENNDFNGQEFDDIDSFKILDEIKDGEDVDLRLGQSADNGNLDLNAVDLINDAQCIDPLFDCEKNVMEEENRHQTDVEMDETNHEDQQNTKLEPMDDVLSTEDPKIGSRKEDPVVTEMECTNQKIVDQETKCTGEENRKETESTNKCDKDDRVDFLKKMKAAAQQNVSDLDEKIELIEGDKSTSQEKKRDDGELPENFEEGDEDIEDEEEPEVESHPYLYLIENFEVPKEQMNFTTVGACKTLKETAVHVVNTRSTLIKMLQNLKNAQEIAVDLQMEERQYKTHICLIEISTKDVDYIIDAQKLRNESLLLTEIFINPKIVKIVSRAEPILSCLQQKLRLYMVNIFDVEKAKFKLFEPPQKNWAILTIIKNDFSVERDRIPNVDFRIRPITEQYKTYCRFIPHYLIYIYHDYKNKMLIKDVDLYKDFLSYCRDACKVLYADTKTMILKSFEDELKNRHNCELEVLKKLFAWRNDVARKTNVTAESILNKGGLMNIVKCLPVEENEILSFCDSKHLRKDVPKILNMINDMKQKFHVYNKKYKQRKRLLSACFAKDFDKPGKRRNERTEFPNKKRRYETRASTATTISQNNTRNNKFMKANTSSTSAPTSLYKNFLQSTFSASPSNISRPTSGILDENAVTRNRPSSHEPASNMLSGVFDSRQNLEKNFNMTMSKSMLLNPTNVPSALTFQSDLPVVTSGPIRNQFGSDVNNMSNYTNFSSSTSMEDTLQRSFRDPEQTRDNLRRQQTNPGNFGGRRYQNLNDNDQGISLPDRNKQFRPINRNRENLWNRRY